LHRSTPSKVVGIGKKRSNNNEIRSFTRMNIENGVGVNLSLLIARCHGEVRMVLIEKKTMK